MASFLAPLLLWPIGSSNISHGSENEPFALYLSSLAPPPADEALADIPDLGRKLLALRSYIRARSYISDRWSWTEQEIRDFQGSEEQKALLAEVAAVSAHFAQTNPGYKIYANTKVRSLDVQIKRWNSNESVGMAAAEILEKWEGRFPVDIQEAETADTDKITRWLARFKSSKRANLAAPGLTLHGRAHAIDFQIMHKGKIIAGANSKQIDTIWRADKWDIKLKESIATAGPSFEGPLVSPNEPWHYNYNSTAQHASQ